MLLGNRNSTSVDSNEILNISVKNAVKILGVHFSCDFRLRQTLNFDEIIKSVKEKLKIWKWRDLQYGCKSNANELRRNSANFADFAEKKSELSLETKVR